MIPARVQQTLPCGFVCVESGLIRAHLEAWLSWSAIRRHEIALTFPGGGEIGDVTWVFDVALLAGGIDAPVGLGDVSVLPDLDRPSVRELVLSSPDGQATLRVAVADLVGFLNRIGMASIPPPRHPAPHDVVPHGTRPDAALDGAPGEGWPA